MRHAQPCFSPWLAFLLVPLACGHGGTPTAAVVVPGVPGAVQATAGSASVTLQWAAAANAASYCVYYASSPDVAPANWSTLPEGHRLLPVASPLLVAGLTNGTTYTFVVTAWNAAGDRESAPSNAVQATPDAAVAPGWTAPVTSPPVTWNSTTATFGGHITNPDGYTTAVWFEFGTSTTYGDSTAAQQFAAAGPIDVTASLTGLAPSTTYHHRLVSENSGGRFAGADVSFTTLAEPQVLLGDLDGPGANCFDGTFVYLFEIYGGRLRRVHATTGAATTLATVGTQGNSGCLTMLGQQLWFATADALYRVRSDGSEFAPVAWLSDISQLLADPSGLYVRHGQAISWIDLAGTQGATLYVRTPQSSEGFGGGLAVDATHLYWTDYWRGTVEKLAFAGGPKVVLAVGQNRPHSLWREGNTLWFADDTGLQRIATAGGTVTTVGTATGAFTKVGERFYGANENNVFVVDAATGLATTLAIGAHAVDRPIVTDTRILWLRGGNHWYPPLGALLWIPRP